MYSPQSLHRWGITHSESMERLAYSQGMMEISVWSLTLKNSGLPTNHCFKTGEVQEFNRMFRDLENQPLTMANKFDDASFLCCCVQ